MLWLNLGIDATRKFLSVISLPSLDFGCFRKVYQHAVLLNIRNGCFLNYVVQLYQLLISIHEYYAVMMCNILSLEMLRKYKKISEKTALRF